MRVWMGKCANVMACSLITDLILIAALKLLMFFNALSFLLLDAEVRVVYGWLNYKFSNLRKLPSIPKALSTQIPSKPNKTSSSRFQMLGLIYFDGHDLNLRILEVSNSSQLSDPSKLFNLPFRPSCPN